MVLDTRKQPLAIDKIFLLLYAVPLFCLLIPQPMTATFLVRCFTSYT